MSQERKPVWQDASAEERDFIESHGEILRALRQRGADCPPIEELMAAMSGTFGEGPGAQVMAHVKTCVFCQTLTSDLEDDAFAKPTPQEEARIRERVFDAVPGQRSAYPRWRWWPAPVAALAALTLAALGIWSFRSAPVAPPVVHQADQTTRSLPAFASRVEKPPIRLPAAALLFRGRAETDQGQYLEELGAALEPYRRNDLEEAARRLEPLRVRYKDRAEPWFYHAAALLLLDRPADAIPAFLAARQVSRDAGAREAAWYLAVSYARAGRSEEAAAELRLLCRDVGPRRPEACAALSQMGR